jgi:DNA-binding PadR family transcriptional regulator
MVVIVGWLRWSVSISAKARGVGSSNPPYYNVIIDRVEETFDGVSSSTLSSRLEKLVDAGYLSREQYAEIPPRVEYDLTRTGKQLCHRLEPLLEWVEDQESTEL